MLDVSATNLLQFLYYHSCLHGCSHFSESSTRYTIRSVVMFWLHSNFTSEWREVIISLYEWKSKYLLSVNSKLFSFNGDSNRLHCNKPLHSVCFNIFFYNLQFFHKGFQELLLPCPLWNGFLFIKFNYCFLPVIFNICYFVFDSVIEESFCFSFIDIVVTFTTKERLQIL